MKFQQAFRKFVEEIIVPDGQAREEDGKRPSQNVFDEMAKLNIIAMRLGTGAHLKGRTLMGGIVKPEEVSTVLGLLFLIQKTIHKQSPNLHNKVRLFP